MCVRDWIDNLGGRRFLLCVGCAAINSALLWFGKLTDGSYTAIIMGTVGAYLTANTVQKFRPEGGSDAVR